jgi:hypothetical protein
MFFLKNPVMTPLVNSSALYLGALAIGYGLLLGGLGYLWWRGPRLNGYQGRLCLGLVALALLLGNSLSHQYYFVLALPLLWTLLAGTAGSSGGWGIKLAAFAVYLIFSIPTPGDPLPKEYTHGIKSAEVGIDFAAGMLLWGIGLYALRREFSAQAIPPGTAGNNLVVEEITAPA